MIPRDMLNIAQALDCINQLVADGSLTFSGVGPADEQQKWASCWSFGGAHTGYHTHRPQGRRQIPAVQQQGSDSQDLGHSKDDQQPEVQKAARPQAARLWLVSQPPDCRACHLSTQLATDGHDDLFQVFKSVLF